MSPAIPLVLLSCLALLSACSGEPQATAPRPTPVRVQSATSGPASPAIQTNGIVEIKDEMRLSFKLGGVIKSIPVSAGQLVRAGERLAEIELTEVNAQVEQARQLAEKAQRDLERGERLYADQVISLEQLQDLRTQAEVQRAQLKSAQFNRGYSVITAPSDGVVLRTLAEERELVPAGQAVVLLGARDGGYVVRAALADREIVQLKLGDPAEIRMDAFPGQTFRGSLTEIASAADSSRLFPIEIRFDAQPQSLASGLVAKISVSPSTAQANKLTYVPIGAVVEGDGNSASVFVLNGDHVKRRPVRIAFIGADSVALTEGLRPGEPVVTEGALYLEENERIEVVREGTQVVENTGRTSD
jgi:RND family efflux transporter MFP subunit